MLLSAGVAEVAAVGRKLCQGWDGTRRHRDKRLGSVFADVFTRLDLLSAAGVACALHRLHQLGPAVQRRFAAIEASSSVCLVVLQGSISQRSRVERRQEQQLRAPALGRP